MTAPAPHVLCVLFPPLGHSIPMVGVIARLVERGCRVTALTGPAVADRLRDTGAEVVEYRAPIRADLPETATREELTEAVARMLAEILAVSPDIESACPAPPDVVVHDVAMGVPARVLAAVWDRPAVRMIPFLASNEHFSLDDTFAEIAADDPAPPDAPSPAARRYGEMLVDHAAAHGLTEEGTAAALGADHELSIVLVPREFQIHGDTFGADHLFVGPSPLAVTEPWTPPASGRPVILLTMGTSSVYSAEFFTRVAHDLASAGYHVVVGLGIHIAADELGPLPEAVEVHQWIPVGAVLEHARAVVTQGGMGSVMESLSHGVPALFVPRLPEQRLNARRAEELGVALVVDEADATPARIVAGVRGVAEDDALRARLADLSARGREAGGAGRAAEAIDRFARERVTG